MDLLKSITRNPPLRAVTSWLAALCIRLIFVTNRWTTVRGDIPQRLQESGTAFLPCSWHGRIMMMPLAWNRRSTIRALLSESRDGQVIGAILNQFGYTAITGSTRRGGTAAMRKVLKALAQGDTIAITPDGPRGPAMRVSPGIVVIAALSGAPIVPVSFATTRRRVLNTWDRFMVALPFGRGVFVWGEPIEVPRGLSDDEAAKVCRKVEDAINVVTAEADRLSGVEPIAAARVTAAGE